MQLQVCIFGHIQFFDTAQFLGVFSNISRTRLIETEGVLAPSNFRRHGLCIAAITIKKEVPTVIISSGRAPLIGFIFLVSLPGMSGCFGGSKTSQSNSQLAPPCVGDGTFYPLGGTATYDYVPAVGSGGFGWIAYSAKTKRPVRRAVVQAISNGAPIAESRTDDQGNFSLNVPGGCGVSVRVLAKAQTNLYHPDANNPGYCNGASWDIRVVDNTNGKAVYGMEGSEQYTAALSGISLNAALEYSSGYTKRVSAPFAILDTAISETELVCTAKPDITFPLLYFNWSKNNNDTQGDLSTGDIGGTFYTSEAGVGNIYVLGKEDVDTDEFDSHVIAHEMGHYLEDQLFRSDSIGYPHSTSEMLDPRVAFGEGYGNAISAMTFNDPLYVDTYSQGQEWGFTISIDKKPLNDSRGVYTEKSVQYFLWNLFQNRASSVGAASFDRIFATLKNRQASTPAFTSVLSFAAYYNQDYGAAAESLRTLWETDLDTPYNALCTGTCSGDGIHDTADPFDRDNDIGIYYATNRHYGYWLSDNNGGLITPPLRDANFWKLYRDLSSGVNSATQHDQTNWGNYQSPNGTGPENKFGNVRWYRYVPSSDGTKTISVGNTGISCTRDVLDMYVYQTGSLVAYDEAASGSSTAGCPKVTFYAIAGQVYTLYIMSPSPDYRIAPDSEEVPSFDITVSP